MSTLEFRVSLFVHLLSVVLTVVLFLGLVMMVSHWVLLSSGTAVYARDVHVFFALVVSPRIELSFGMVVAARNLGVSSSIHTPGAVLTVVLFLGLATVFS